MLRLCALFLVAAACVRAQDVGVNAQVDVEGSVAVNTAEKFVKDANTNPNGVTLEQTEKAVAAVNVAAKIPGLAVVGSLLQKVAGIIRGLVSSLVNKAGTDFLDTVARLLQLILGLLENKTTDVELINGITALVNALLVLVKALLQKVIGIIGGLPLVGPLLQGTVGSLLNPLLDSVNNAISSAVGTVTSLGPLKSVVQLVFSILKTVLPLLAPVIQLLKPLLEPVIRGLQGEGGNDGGFLNLGLLGR
jgi:flagellin-specific chaperone FliS